MFSKKKKRNLNIIHENRITTRLQFKFNHGASFDIGIKLLVLLSNSLHLHLLVLAQLQILFMYAPKSFSKMFLYSILLLTDPFVKTIFMLKLNEARFLESTS